MSKQKYHFQPGIRLLIISAIVSFLNIFAIAADMDVIPPQFLAAGNKGGIYYSKGKLIAERASEKGSPVEVLESEGSRVNLTWLSEGKAQLCIAQGDSIYNAINGIFPFEKKITNIQAIASLHIEAVHILIRQGLHISQIDGFRGKRIAIGPEGSGTEANARSLIEAAGIAMNEVNALHYDFNDAVKAIIRGDIDIAFFTSGFPNNTVRIIAENGGVYFFKPDADLLERVLSISSFCIVTTIPAGTYSGQNEDIPTLGVPAFLIARTDLSPQLGYLIADIVYSDKSISKNVLPKKLLIPLHPGAYRFYQEKRLFRRNILAWGGLFILFASICGLFFWKFRDILFFFKKHAIYRVLALIIFIWIPGSFLLYFFEHRINDTYLNPWKAIWYSLVNWLSFGSKEPITPAGRAISVTMLVLGAGCVAWLTAEIASIFVAKRLGGKMMTRYIKDHYIIINWNEKGPGIIEELRNPELEQEPIFVVTKQKDPPPCLSAYKSIYHFYDTSIGESILQQINLADARSLIVLADDSINEDAADAETILILLAISKLLANKSRHPNIVAEILQPHRVELAKCSNMFNDEKIEIVSSMKLLQNLIAQVTITPGLTRVFDDLLTFGAQSNEIYGFPLSKSCSGKCFRDILKLSLDLRDQGLHVIPIAIYRNGKSYINPTEKEIGTLEENDLLYAICEDRKSLKKSLNIIENLLSRSN